MTGPKPLEKDADAQREPWSSPLPDLESTDETIVLHPRADGEDPDFEAIEMAHRGITTQR